MDQIESPLRRVVQWFRARQLVTDTCFAAAIFTLSIVLRFDETQSATERSWDIGATLLVIGMAAPLIWRRSHGVAVLYAVAAFSATFWVADYPDGPAGPAFVVAYYSIGAHVDRAKMRLHAVIVTTVVLAVIVVGVFIPEEDVPLAAVPSNLAIFATALAVGSSVKSQRDHRSEMEERLRSNEAQRVAEASKALAEERTRIARELHDVVAHSMSVVVIQAGAARRILEHDPAAAAESLEVIESTGRQSLTEMRQLLGVLRAEDGGEARAPQPSVADLDALLGSLRDAGLESSITVEGDPSDVSPAVGLTLFRVAQEALTNTLKHAGPARSDVRLEIGSDRVVLDVNDDGRGAAAPSVNGGGLGTIGMRERVESMGGRFTSGPRPGGGYGVRAEIPQGAT